MQEDLRREFIEWVEGKTNAPIEINNGYFLACLEESINQHLNTSIDGVPIIKRISKEESMRKIMQSWISTTKMMLQYPNIGFKDQIAPTGNVAATLLDRLETLSLKCLR